MVLEAPIVPSLLTIESTLYLFATDDPLKVDFLTGIEASTNTQDIEQLRLAGWEEDIWVLLLCYLMLSPQHKLGQWLRNALPEYITVPPLDISLQNTEAAEPSTNLDNAETEQAECLMDLVRTAASSCSADSVWSSRQWTPDFIARTAGRMLEHESFVVMVPHDDTGDGVARLWLYFHGSIQ